MATRRMLHNKISRSLQVNRLSLEAQLLFTWLISHADDEGRLYGEPEYIKGTVVPLKESWTSKEVGGYLVEIEKQGLIYYWQDSDRTIIEFVKWLEHQKIRKDRLQHSLLPTYLKRNDNQTSTSRQPDVNQTTAQANRTEDSKEEIKKSEANGVADKSLKSIRAILNEKSFSSPVEIEVTNRHQEAAYYAWKTLEPDNKTALQTTYLNAVRKGLGADKIRQFVSEIKQDRTIKNPGKIFNKKVSDYCKLKEDDKS